MNTAPVLPGSLIEVFGPSPGIIGRVDRLFELCRCQPLRLEWAEGRLLVHFMGSGERHYIDRPRGLSIFRAMLARIAAFCNHRNPNSVSPYGGQGELITGGDPPVILRVSFKNEPYEQFVELHPTPPAANGEA